MKGKAMSANVQAAKELDGMKGYIPPGRNNISALMAVDLMCGVESVEKEVTLNRGNSVQFQPQDELGETEQPQAPVKSA